MVSRFRSEFKAAGSRRPPLRLAVALTCLLGALPNLPNLALLPASAAERGPTVARCELTGPVDAGSAAYLKDCIQRAQQQGREALLIRLDTPGGSLEETRRLAGAMIEAPLPVLVWVGPAGARAGSAGVFIALAAHVVAMAPGTNIGAAHPVGLAGEDPEKSLGSRLALKVENDTAAFAQALARQRGRNEVWAGQAVRESVSVPAERALTLGVAELLAPTEAEFLSNVEGQRLLLPSGEHVLHTRGATIQTLDPTVGQRLVHSLANPALAYILFVGGALLIVLELSHPGGFFAGIVGSTCLVLALIAFSVLPIRTGAVLILALGAGLIAAELMASHGALALGGTGLLFLGGLLLVDRARPGWAVDPPFGLPLEVLLPTVGVLGGGAAYVVLKAAQTRRLPQRGGDVGLLGETGKALSALSPEGGEVFVHGEHWRAVANPPLPEGAQVVVRRVEGLTLYVDEVSDGSGRRDGSPHPGGSDLRGIPVGGAGDQRI